MKLIPLKAAMERLGFKKTKAMELVAAGKLRAFRSGNRVMIDADSIDAYHLSLPEIKPQA
jgi:excisionase family DNA binding protein